MSSQWKQALEEKYEFMNRDLLLNKGYSSAYTQWSIEVQQGWSNILGTMCQNIANILEKYDLPQDAFVPLQIKEKFASLRVYWRMDKENFTPIIDFLGQGSLDLNNYDSEFKKEILKIIDEACEQSKTTCEICGEKGEKRTDLRWISTLCDKHYQERINCKK